MIFSLLSGALLALAFPKLNLFWLAWVALIPFFIALNRAKSLKGSLFCGLCFGIVFFGIHLSWVLTLFRFVQWWIVLGWIGLTVYQTFFILLFVVAAYRFRNNAFYVAALWSFVEWLRAWGPWGVTGGDLGYSQAHFLPLIQIASFTSVYGVSFLVVFFNASLAQLIIDRKKWLMFTISLSLVSVSIVYGLLIIPSQTSTSSVESSPVPSPQCLRIAIIQPNVDQKDRMDPYKVNAIFDLQEKMSRQALEKKPDLIIWTETAVFTYMLNNPALFPRLQQLAREGRAWIIFGTPHFESASKSYNSIISLSPSGEAVARYDKQRLVPFGEYLPLRPVLFPILRGVGYYDSKFDSNPHPHPLFAKGVLIAPAVCFESTFPALIRGRMRGDPAFILTVTNDAWFGDSSAAYFHLNTGVFRAVENRKLFVQAGNTGISAVIDPYGRILKRTGLNRQEILTFEIPLP